MRWTPVRASPQTSRRKLSLGPVVRVAAIATAIVAVLYAVLVALLVALVSHRLTAETDHRLAAHLADYQRESHPAQAASAPVDDADDAPVYLWRVGADGTVMAVRAGSPTLPSAVATGAQQFPCIVLIGGVGFRVAEAPGSSGSRLVAAESLAQEAHVRGLLIDTALVVSPILIGGAFLSAFAIGRQASKPIELARRQQLEFTADASHELRTPLTVIDAEVGLALSSDRTVHAYRDSLRRVSREAHRLRRIVEDLLWLARFDSQPPPPQAELIDVATLVRQGAERFEAVVRSRGLTLTINARHDAHTQIAAPPEWIDRLVGVLLDNAVRFAKPGGQVEVTVNASSGHVVLSVCDDGRGIPAGERDRLFDRFHRMDDGVGGVGAGLGLAIGDAVVRSTHGSWTVGDSRLGGARLTVTWPRPHAGRADHGARRRDQGDHRSEARTAVT